MWIGAENDKDEGGVQEGEKDSNEVEANNEEVTEATAEAERLKFKPNHPPDLIIGSPTAGVRTRSSLNKNVCAFYIDNAFISEIEPSSYDIALNDESWILAMHEELN